MKDNKLRILHVGCGNAYLTNKFDDIDEIRLDLCPEVKPDIQLDVCEIGRLPAESFDGVWMCHLLEHVHEHQVPVVLEGIRHVLKDDGFLFATVPDLRTVLKEILDKEFRLDELFYTSYSGVEVRPLDIIYGYQKEVAKETSRGVLYNQHKTGFDADLMLRRLSSAGFKKIFMAEVDWEVKALACVNEPTEWIKRNFKLNEQEILQTI